MLTEAQKAKIEAQQKADYFEAELALHTEQVGKLTDVIAQAKINTRFTEQEIELLKDLDVSEFKPTAPKIAYELNDKHVELQRSIRLTTMEYNLTKANEKLELDLKAYAIESAKVKLLKNGVELHALTEEEILSQGK